MIDLQRDISKPILKQDFTAHVILESLSEFFYSGAGISKNYRVANSGSPEVEPWFCPWLILFKY